MRTLTDRQKELVGRAGRRVVNLVKLTTYSDRAAKTVDTVFYFSDRAARYDYGNTGTVVEFWPLLRSLGSLRLEMHHIPEPASALAPPRALSLNLANVEYELGDKRLSEKLREQNVEFATVEVAQLDLNPASTSEADACDFTSLAGDEHVVWYRGELVKVARVTSTEIELAFESERPPIPWRVLSDPSTNDPRHLGQRLPIIYGARTRSPGLGVTVGWATTLSAAITSATTGNVKVGDTSGFPGGSYTLRIASEEVTASTVDGETINISARAQNGTPATAHAAGTYALEMVSSAKWCFAGHECAGVDDLWVRNVYSGELMRVETAYTANTTDTVEGDTATTVTFTAAELRSLLNAMLRSAYVSQQPELESVPSLYDVAAREFDEGFLVGTDMTLSLDNDAGEAVLAYDSNVGDVLECTWTGVADTRAATRWRFRLTYSYVAPSGTGNMQLNVSNTDWTETFTHNKGTSASGVVEYSNWVSLGGSGQVQDINGEVLRIWITHTLSVYAGYGVGIRYENVVIEVEVDGALTEIQATEIQGAEVGFGLEFFADLRGYKVPAGDTNFSVAAGTLIEHPVDVIRHRLAILGGAGHGAIDATSFSATLTNLGSAKFACDLRELGDTPEEIDGRLAFECRSNLVPMEGASGQLWKLFSALGTNAWPGSARSLEDFGEVVEEGRGGDTFATRFRALYALDPSLSGRIEERFTQVVVADADTNDLTDPSVGEFEAAEERYGRRDHAGFGFLAIQHEATAKNVLSYLASEMIRANGHIYTLADVPWDQAYDLELGDIVSFEPAWKAFAVKARLIGFEMDFERGPIGLRLVEVH